MMGNRRERYETDRLKRDLQKMKTRQFFREVWSNKMARVGIIIIAFFALMAIFGPVLRNGFWTASRTFTARSG